MVGKIFKSVKNILRADPRLIYEKEWRLVDKPFYFPGTSGRGILLIHGWSSTPYEVRRLGTYLNEKGYTVHAPMLRGHGTVPKDLESVRWQDWLEDAENAYRRLSQECEKVYLGGTSIGSNLALILASRHREVSALVLMATPYRLKFEKAVVNFAHFLRIFKKYNTKIYPPTFGVSNSITRLISYKSYPIHSSLEAAKAIAESRKFVPLVKQPCFAIQSRHDHIVKKNSLEEIYNNLGSAVKKKRYIDRVYHTFISDIKNGNIFEEILDFLNKN